ncbi:hypothetical protein RP20_CCG012414 [Aedes albopictus]|nr:hypothetical protein RP20_CCG012414 [Aedes albopictus]
MFRNATTLVLVINCSEPKKQLYRSQLGNRNIHESSSNAAERAQDYELGGVQFIETTVLVTDFLLNRVPVKLITGIIVVRANKIKEPCPVAIALRL